MVACAALPNTLRSDCDVGARTDGQAHAAGAAAARLGQRAPRVGGAVGALVAVVVGQSVGQHDQQPPRRTSACLQDRRAVPDRRTQSRVGAGLEAVQPPDHLGVEVVVEPLDRHHAHRAPTLRVVGVQRHAVAEIVQRDGQVGDRRALLLVHGAPDRPGSAADPETSSSSSTDRSRRRRRLSR